MENRRAGRSDCCLRLQCGLTGRHDDRNCSRFGRAQRGFMASERQNDCGATPSTGQSTHSCVVPSRGRRFALIWSGLGFIAASLFWSAVGLGPGFTLAVRIPAAAPQHTSSISAPVKLPHRLPVTQFTEANAAAEADCITLALDRSVQQIRPDSCPAEDHDLAYAESSGRQDRLLPPDHETRHRVD